jgi:hypothetical protein
MEIARKEYLKNLAIEIKQASNTKQIETLIAEEANKLNEANWSNKALLELWGDLEVAIKEQYHGSTDDNYTHAQGILDKLKKEATQ